MPCYNYTERINPTMNILNQPNAATLDFKQFVDPDAFAPIGDGTTIDGISDAVKRTWFKSVFDQIMQGGTVQDTNGDDITDKILEIMASEEYHHEDEELLTEFYSRALLYKPTYDIGLLCDNIVPIQHSLALAKNPDPELANWPLPSDVSNMPRTAIKNRNTQVNITAYNDSDMCVASGVAIRKGNIQPLEISIASLYNPEALCVFIQDADDWKTLVGKMRTEATKLHTMNIIDDPTMVILSQIFNAPMENTTLTLAIALRSNVSPNVEPGCFGRVLMELLKTEKDRFMPVSLRNLWYPRNIIFVNAIAHTHATPDEIRNEWRQIMKECKKRARPVAINELRKLDKSHNSSNPDKECGHGHDVDAVCIDFQSGVPKVPQMYKRIKKLVETESQLQRSAHPYYDKRMTFARASRTRPDDFNKKGCVRTVKNYKDLHLYCDCSGSVSFEMLQNTIVAAIKVAKKLDLDLYLTTWGSSISQATRVPIMNHTDKQIITYIVNLPMCGGGTDPELVWDRCTETAKRRDEIAIMITDFCFSTPRQNYMPQNLYYMPLIPCRGDMRAYKEICNDATDYLKNLSQIYQIPAQKVRKKFLF